MYVLPIYLGTISSAAQSIFSQSLILVNSPILSVWEIRLEVVVVLKGGADDDGGDGGNDKDDNGDGWRWLTFR